MKLLKLKTSDIASPGVEIVRAHYQAAQDILNSPDIFLTQNEELRLRQNSIYIILVNQKKKP